MKPFGHDFPMPWEQRASLENPAVSLSDPHALAMLGLAEPGGLAVTAQSSMGLSAVWACVSLLSRAKAWLPTHVMRKEGARSKVIAEDEPLYDLLRFRPNPYQTAHVFKLAMMARVLLWGNFYAEIQRDRRTGEVLALQPILQPVKPRLKDGVKTFMVGGLELANDDVFHMMGVTMDGVEGMSPIAAHRRTFGMGLEAIAYGEAFYRNGTRLAGVLEHPNKVSKDAAERLRESWTAAYAGKQNAGKVAILEEGMKFTALTMPMDDAEYVATRKLTVTEIARIFGVPPHKIGDLDKATFSNIEHQSIEFVGDALMPWIDQWESEIYAKLISDDQKRRRVRAKVNVKAMLRGDMKSQMEAIKMGRDSGLYSPNDGRDELDLNAIEGEGGDEYTRPMNHVPIGTPAPPPKAATPDPEPEPGA